MGDRAAGEGLQSPGWSLESVYRLEYPRLVRLAGLLLADFRAGEDIAQEAFARLMNGRGRVADPVAYLRVTVVNLSRSRIRRAVVARKLRARLPDPAAGTDVVADRTGTQQVVRQALRGLSVRQRQVVVLRYYEDMTDADVAGMLGISVGSVKVHLRRALGALAQELNDLKDLR